MLPCLIDSLASHLWRLVFAFVGMSKTCIVFKKHIAIISSKVPAGKLCGETLSIYAGGYKS